MKSAQCTQTFYGHLNSVNSVSFNLKGDMIASCDADGVTKVWDIRMVKEQCSFDIGELPANKVIFDKSSKMLGVAGEDGTIVLFDVQEVT